MSRTYKWNTGEYVDLADFQKLARIMMYAASGVQFISIKWKDNGITNHFVRGLFRVA